MEDTIRASLTTALQPANLTIHNDSHLHSHHSAMRGNTSSETHFRLEIVSDAFRGKMQAARHRMVYQLLGEEMKKDGGIHALQLKTKTVEEDERDRRREEEERGTPVDGP
jgi:stress-induced morphogen